MSSNKQFEFTNNNIDTFLKDLAKEYRKHSSKTMPAELIIVGGASVLINYHFRNMTTDIDALIYSSSAMKEAINTVGDKHGLPNGWLNADFVKTASYSEKLSQYSIYHKTYSNIVTVRTIASEYLIVMKLRSGRQYKNDLSDIVGILAEHKKQERPITIEQIKKATIELYGDWLSLPDTSRAFIENVMIDGQFEHLYSLIERGEQETKELLVRFEKDYSDIASISNANQIAES
ncbi:MAG: hypothetical protein IJ875_02750, partial [Solobacterium sp.]|nr:hypothetical protein [Solobacterium sp.]